MEPIKIQIVIDRAAAILAGKAQHGTTAVAVDPGTLTIEQREEMVSLGVDYGTGHLILENARVNFGIGYTTPIVEPTQETIARALDERRANRLAKAAAKAAKAEADAAEQRAKSEQAARAWIEAPVGERLNQWSYKGYEVKVPGYVSPDLLALDLRAAFDKAKAEAQAEADRRNAAIEARVAAARAAEKEAARLRAEALAAFVRDHGTETQRKRRAANLMPDDEILDLVREHVFAPLAHLPRYERMKKSDFHDVSEVQFETKDADMASDSQFEAMEAIRALVPGATVTLRDHIATLTDYEGEETVEIREGFHVAIDWNGWPLSREFAA